MSSKNETPTLILSFLLTVGLVGAGISWLIQQNPNLFRMLNQGLGGTGDPSLTVSPSPRTNGRFSDIQSLPSGLFNYGGSTTWAPIRRDVDPVLQSAHPSFRLRYTDAIGATPGSGTGIRMLLNGELALSQSSRPIDDREYQQAQQRGFSLKQVPVALEGLAIAVHPGLNLPGLNLEQLKAIYTGAITNWSQVGGPNLTIIPYSRRLADGGTVEFFVSNVLNKENLGPTVEYVYSTTDALRKLADNPGGIYYASAPEVIPQCTVRPLPLARQGTNFIPPYQEPLVLPEECPGRRNQLNLPAFKSGQYPITRQMFVVVKQNGSVEQQAGDGYANLLLTNQGQELIEQAGFVRIR